MPQFDFGYSAGGNAQDSKPADSAQSTDDKTSLDTGKIDHDVNGVPAEDVGDNGQVKRNDGNPPSTGGQQQTGSSDAAGAAKDDKADDKPKDDNTDEPDVDKDSNKPLEAGTKLEVDGQTYTVDVLGNVVDKDGNIFKKADEVNAWLKEYDTEEDNKPDTKLSIKSIQDAIGVEITDDNDKPISYDDTPEGVKAYVDAVIDTARQENYDTAINTLYQKYPAVKDFLDYYIANGNSAEGYGQMPDRSNITIDENNEAQQEAIIRTAWQEQGRKGDVDNYINYLKSSGTLLATATEELEGLQEADRQYKEQLEQQAKAKEDEQIAELQKYWNGVHDVVKSRKIAGYQIPESIVVERNGQKLTATPEDFFAYMYNVDENGNTAYQRDLAKETPESRRDDEILRAYLKFVGGNYSNLVNMAINDEKVKQLKLRAKQRNNSSIRITRPQTSAKKNIIDELGYN